MSLTSMLSNRDSSVSRFFAEKFPNSRPITGSCSQALSKVDTIRPAQDLPYGTIGTALDYRTRYFFTITPPERLVAWAGAAFISDDPESRNASPLSSSKMVDGLTLPSAVIGGFFGELERILQEINPVGRALEVDEEAKLTRYCIVLALFDEVFRAGARSGSPLFLGEPKNDVEDLLAIPAGHWVDDISSLLQSFYDNFDASMSTNAVMNPVFDGSRDVGGADADFILDGCIYELKTTINARITKGWLYQLLGYVFLDYSNKYQINEVAIYLSRQSTLFRWPLQEIINVLSHDSSPQIDELRINFEQVVKTHA